MGRVQLAVWDRAVDHTAGPRGATGGYAGSNPKIGGSAGAARAPCAGAAGDVLWQQGLQLFATSLVKNLVDNVVCPAAVGVSLGRSFTLQP